MLLVAGEERELLPLQRALVNFWFPGSAKKVLVIDAFCRRRCCCCYRLEYFFFLVLRW